MANVKISELAAASYAAATDLIELAQGGVSKKIEARVLRGQTVTTLTSVSGVVTIDLSLGNYFLLTLTENITSFTFTNSPGAGFGQTIMICIIQASSAKTMTFPSSFDWEGGVVPTISTGSGAKDLLALTTMDNCTSFEATLSKGRS